MPASVRKTLQHMLTSIYGLLNCSTSNAAGHCILMYHAVGTPIADDKLGLYNISPTLFEKHMRFIASKHRTALSALSEKMLRSEHKTVSVTFDDGYADNLIVAKSVLEQLEIPFTVFVTAGAVAARTSGFLTPEKLKELSECRFANIGSHGMTHRRLAECSDSDLRAELHDSKQLLEDITGREISCISYPHGSVNQRVAECALEAGYRLGACSRFEVNRSAPNKMQLSRIDIWAEDSTAILEQKINGNWDWLKWR